MEIITFTILAMVVLEAFTLTLCVIYGPFSGPAKLDAPTAAEPIKQMATDPVTGAERLNHVRR